MKRSRTCNDLTQLLQPYEECSTIPSFPIKKSRTFENFDLLEREIRDAHYQHNDSNPPLSKIATPSSYQEIFEETQHSLLFDANYYAKCQILNDEDIVLDEMKWNEEYLPDVQITGLCLHLANQLSTSNIASRPSCA